MIEWNLTRLAGISTLIFVGVVALAGCCPPNCPPTPVVPPTDDWNNLYGQGKYDQVIEGTRAASEDPEDAYYAEANLYYGLAELKRGGDPKIALDRLNTAERLSDELKTVDSTLELTLLYRGKMMAYAKLGDLDTAGRYLTLAVEASPDQEKDIQQEFEDAVR